MLPHHQTALDKFLSLYQAKQEFIGILLAGSLAHGYETADSDIDIILVATEDEYRKRSQDQKLAFSLWDICEYKNGYIDCKVVSLDSLKEVAAKGSDAARYAFKDSQLLHSRSHQLAPILSQVSQFPADQQPDRQHRFTCQLLAWKWYLSQAEQKNNPYLRHLAAQKITLFACRIILNENSMLFPYHKWLLEETKRAPQQPTKFQSLIDSFLQSPTFETAQSIADCILEFIQLKEKEVDWPNQFMTDSELNWLHHPPPVDDL
ncbi:hypothetical protein VDG1235_3902 [Verrucomicrobiia bacterium DG1235]|nr:hypothetical protein VDG1235_3902 [Verrucomicrobiae bacterium DG1235]